MSFYPFVLKKICGCKTPLPASLPFVCSLKWPLCAPGSEHWGVRDQHPTQNPEGQRLSWDGIFPQRSVGMQWAVSAALAAGILGEFTSVFVQTETLGHTAENTFHLDVRLLIDPSLGSALLHTEGDLKESSLIIRLIPLLKQLQWFLTITMPNLPSEHKWY